MTNEAPGPGDPHTRVVNEKLEEWDEEEQRWVPFRFLAEAGTGGDGKPLVIYKIAGDDHRIVIRDSIASDLGGVARADDDVEGGHGAGE
jgi:hypothetical protein